MELSCLYPTFVSSNKEINTFTFKHLEIMANSRKVYIVKGSQDGNLGVFSNFKLAYECACDYVIGTPKFDKKVKDGHKRVPATYIAAQRECSKSWNAWIYPENGDYGLAEIEAFEMNNNPIPKKH